jgi:hypothetical protein
MLQPLAAVEDLSVSWLAKVQLTEGALAFVQVLLVQARGDLYLSAPERAWVTGREVLVSALPLEPETPELSFSRRGMQAVGLDLLRFPVDGQLPSLPDQE